MPLTFVTGPVRSGKSRFAERLAMESGGDVTYVATARTDPTDVEWVARIAHHVARRPAAWQTIETGLLDAPSLVEIAGAGRAGAALLVDSLGTWLAAEMSARFEVGGEPAALDIDALEAECSKAADALATSAARAIVVGDEAGWGLVPPYPSPLARSARIWSSPDTRSTCAPRDVSSSAGNLARICSFGSLVRSVRSSWFLSPASPARLRRMHAPPLRRASCR
jgi:adenosylcobinamide kinase/adenosylcobinamide-phosphate guanylyltransferase